MQGCGLEGFAPLFAPLLRFRQLPAEGLTLPLEHAVAAPRTLEIGPYRLVDEFERRVGRELCDELFMSGTMAIVIGQGLPLKGEVGRGAAQAQGVPADPGLFGLRFEAPQLVELGFESRAPLLEFVQVGPGRSRLLFAALDFGLHLAALEGGPLVLVEAGLQHRDGPSGCVLSPWVSAARWSASESADGSSHTISPCGTNALSSNWARVSPVRISPTSSDLPRRNSEVMSLWPSRTSTTPRSKSRVMRNSWPVRSSSNSTP